MNGIQDPSHVFAIQAKLFAKLLKVISAVEKIEKSGYNKHQNYHYSTESDLIAAVRDLMVKNQVLLFTDSEVHEVTKLNKYDKDGKVVGENLITTVKTRHTFCDVETGYTFCIQGTGSGMDNGDKGLYKSLTGALKYFISKNFLVPTEDDPEHDGQAKIEAPKTFSRPTQPVVLTASNTPVGATTPAPLTVAVTTDTSSPTGTKTTVLDTSGKPNDTSHVKEKFNPPPAAPKTQAVNTNGKFSFGKKTVKNEPSFP